MRCGLSESLTLDKAWAIPVSRVRLLRPVGWPQIDNDSPWSIFDNAARLWSDACRISFEYVSAHVDVHVLSLFCVLGQGSDIVCYSQLPHPWKPPLVQYYDFRRDYSFTLDCSWGVPLSLIISHQLGHVLGIGHGPPGNVMCGVFDSRVRTLGDFDREQLTMRYG